jgi:hypothetical protein
VRPVHRDRVGFASPPSPSDMAEAVGLRSALLHCSSFRYFHSPCRVLCTFRSPYLCNIGCRADRGVLTETPRRIRLQVQAALHRRRQQNAGGPHRGQALARACTIQWELRPLFGSQSLSMLLHRRLGLRGEVRPVEVPALRASKPRSISTWETPTKGGRAASLGLPEPRLFQLRGPL